MKITHEEIMEIIEFEIHEETMCAEKSKWLMKRTWNPICKIECFLSAKRFMNHVDGMHLILNKLQKVMKES